VLDERGVDFVHQGGLSARSFPERRRRGSARARRRAAGSQPCQPECQRQAHRCPAGSSCPCLRRAAKWRPRDRRV